MAVVYWTVVIVIRILVFGETDMPWKHTDHGKRLSWLKWTIIHGTDTGVDHNAHVLAYQYHLAWQREMEAFIERYQWERF
jgi:hypothetical protein